MPLNTSCTNIASHVRQNVLYVGVMYCSSHFHYQCVFHQHHTIEELNDVCEVHVVLQNDVSVDLHQSQGDEQNKVARGDILSCPDGLPH